MMTLLSRGLTLPAPGEPARDVTASPARLENNHMVFDALFHKLKKCFTTFRVNFIVKIDKLGLI